MGAIFSVDQGARLCFRSQPQQIECRNALPLPKGLWYAKLLRLASEAQPRSVLSLIPSLDHPPFL